MVTGKNIVVVYVVVAYDVGVERLPKIRALLRRYLLWTQNSVFEGNIRKDVLDDVVNGLLRAIDPRRDSVRVYVKKCGKLITFSLGRPKGPERVI